MQPHTDTSPRPGTPPRARPTRPSGTGARLLWLLALLLPVLLTGAGVGPAAAGSTSVDAWSFRQSSSVNQWWLQVSVTPPAGQRATKVEAIVNGSTWHTMSKQWWGDWTLNKNVGSNPSVVYRAWDTKGKPHDSRPFRLTGPIKPSPSPTGSPSPTTTPKPTASPSPTTKPTASPSPTTKPTASPTTKPTASPTTKPTATATPSPSSTQAFDRVTSDAGYIHTGKFASQIWKSGEFRGSFTRKVAGDHARYRLELNQSAGGLDTDVIHHQNSGKRVDSVSSGLKVTSSINAQLQVQGSAHWWAGPKFIIGNEVGFGGFTDDYEVYVIEKASLSPAEFEKRMFGRSTFLGETQQDGATYRHFRTDLGAAGEQIWAVRQQWRSSWTTSVSPLLKKWRASGMTNGYMQVEKPVNFESYGAMSGSVEFTGSSYNP